MIKHSDKKWDVHMLKIAKLCSEMSKDPSTKVGSVIKAPDKTIVSTGYNGFPADVDDNEEWYQDRTKKYDLIIHAEMNALKHTNNSEIVDGSTIYVYPLLPCYDCAQEIVKTGIKRVVTVNHIETYNHHSLYCLVCGPEKECAKTRWSESWGKSTEFMETNGIEIIYYDDIDC